MSVSVASGDHRLLLVKTRFCNAEHRRAELTLPPYSVPHASPPQNGHLSSSPTGQPIPFPMGDRRPSVALVGVGISPDNTSDPMAIPNSHQRRSSERRVDHHHPLTTPRNLPLTAFSHMRISPPGTLREHAQPPSSYPIQHGSFGSSPVKTSALARRVDEDIEV